jgi:3-deoxy-D-manno-octulosonate 8-phosphate phosphatase (KDO 8-P phosphatase)
VTQVPALSTAPPAELRNIRFVVFDFDGVFTDDAVYVSQEGTEMVRCWRGDGLGLRKLDTLNIGSAIISTEINPVVGLRARKMRIQCFQGIEDKCARLTALAAELGIGLDQVAYVGNDINDLACFSSVGLPIGVPNAHPDVLGTIRYSTQRPGGYGAVREVCDVLERAHHQASRTSASVAEA